MADILLVLGTLMEQIVEIAILLFEFIEAHTAAEQSSE